MKMKLAATAALALTSLAACSGDGDDASPAEPTATVTVTVTAEPDGDSGADDGFPDAESVVDNLGENALKIGETRTGTEVKTTVVEVRDPMPPGYAREPGPGNRFIGIRLKQCLRAGADSTDLYATSESDWAAVAPGGEQYTGGQSWTNWPTPKFPEGQGMVPGRCNTGWMTVEVPKAAKIARILWAPDLEPLAEWLPRAKG